MAKSMITSIDPALWIAVRRYSVGQNKSLSFVVSNAIYRFLKTIDEPGTTQDLRTYENIQKNYLSIPIKGPVSFNPHVHEKNRSSHESEGPI